MTASSTGRKALSALLVAAAVGVALSPASASAKGWRHGHGGYGAAAFTGGLLIGAIVASERVYVSERACWTEKRRRIDDFGDVYVQRVRVCD